MILPAKPLFSIRSALGLLLFCSLALYPGLKTEAAKQYTADDILQITSKGFTKAAKRAIPAVVYIEVERTLNIAPGSQSALEDEFMRRFFGQGSQPPRDFRQRGQGTGFIISKDGYILTNHHVIGDAVKITVRLHDGREFKAKRVGSDDKSEVAVIKIDGKNLPVMPFGVSEDLEIGEWVMAIGTPFGLNESVTVGVVSAKGRSNIGITDYEDFIQTDAAINPGNSGGPLINIWGEVIGINTAIYSKSGGYMGIGFAVPIDMAKKIKEQIIKTGRVSRGFLGIVIRDVTKDLAAFFGLKEAGGILVQDVVEDSAADKSGIKRDDIILEIQGTKANSVAAFRNRVASSPPGTQFTLAIFREGKKMALKVKTGELPGGPEETATVGPEEEATQALGLSIQALTKELAQRFGYESESGVFVSAVSENGLAADKQIQPGDLIMSVNRTAVPNVRAFVKAFAKAKKDGKVLLLLKNKRGTRYVVITFDDD